MRSEMYDEIGVEDKVNTAGKNVAQETENGKIFRELGRLNARCCEMIEALHQGSTAEQEMAFSETGELIKKLFVAHEDFIDNMRLVHLKQKHMELQSQQDEVENERLAVLKRMEKRAAEVVDPFVRQCP